jgi:predicted metal-dependent hydrolase
LADDHAAPRIVEYISAHELTHVSYAHHNPDFWKKLERAMPDFAIRKQWLAANGASASAL